MAISAPRDANSVPTLMGVSSADGTTPVTIYVDPTTHRVLTQSSGGSAPTDATYVTLSTNVTLTNERVLTGTANQITITDNGAGSTVVLSLPQSIATSSTPTFASMTLTAVSSLTLGTASTNTGAIIFKNSSNANNTVLQAGAAGAALTFTLPTTDGANGEVLTTDGNGVMSWTAVAGGGANTALSNLAAVAINTTLLPGADDGAALGSGTFSFSDLFLASGGVINFANGDLTLTHSSNLLTLAGGNLSLGTNTLISHTVRGDATDGLIIEANNGTDVAIFGAANTTNTSLLGAVAVTGAVLPSVDNTPALGASGQAWADLFLGSGSVVNFDAGDMTITHSANTLTVAGGTIALGVATATTLNGLTVTSSTGTLTVTNAKTLSVSNTLTLAGTDSTTMTFPTTSASIARTDAGQTFTGVQAMTSPDITTSLTTPSTTFSLVNATATTVNFAGAATTMAIGAAGGNATFNANIQLAENSSIKLDPAGSADGKYTGITISGTAGATLAFGDLIYLDPTDSRWELVDANAAAAADGDARGILGICVLAAAADGDPTTVLLNGVVRADTAFPAFTINNPVYVSETAGDVTQTQPTTTDVVIRIVGSALTADEMYFCPDRTWITHT